MPHHDHSHVNMHIVNAGAYWLSKPIIDNLPYKIKSIIIKMFMVLDDVRKFMNISRVVHAAVFPENTIHI